jgi:hypothetical protein
MVGGHPSRRELGRRVWRNEGGQALARTVYDGEVLAHIDRYAAKHRTYVVDRRGHLQGVADDDGNTEAGTGTWSAAEGQRDRKARVVHSIKRVVHSIKKAPQAISHAKDAAARKGAGVDHLLEEIRAVIVITEDSLKSRLSCFLDRPGQRATANVSVSHSASARQMWPHIWASGLPAGPANSIARRPSSRISVPDPAISGA